MKRGKTTLFPALRCRMGDWIYYITALTFDDVAQWVQSANELHESKKLSEWIQRKLDGEHAARIAKYLGRETERMFNAIVVGVYRGKPHWAPLKISVTKEAELPPFTEDEQVEFERSVGMLQFSGKERLFAIDGQHRVAGIKRAIDKNKKLGDEEICAIFVGHSDTEDGLKRTRRLFTTLNKTAKKTTVADIVALDEDDAFAVLARRVYDDYHLFGSEENKLIALKGSSALTVTDTGSLTSIIGLYEIAQDLKPFLFEKTNLSKPELKRSRPEDDILNNAYRRFCHYWKYLTDSIPEYQDVVIERGHNPGYYREHGRQHLMFRPVGQRAFAGAVGLLVSRGKGLEKAIDALRGVDPRLERPLWAEILWSRIEGAVIPKNRIPAETLLLSEIDEPARNTAAQGRLKELLKARG